jgi:hypothetical protein
LSARAAGRIPHADQEDVHDAGDDESNSCEEENNAQNDYHIVLATAGVVEDAYFAGVNCAN